MTGILIERGNLDTDTEIKSCEDKAEIGAMLPPAREGQKLPAN